MVWCKPHPIRTLTTCVVATRGRSHHASVGRRPNVPPQLKRRPFTVDEARDTGLTLRALSGKSWSRISSGLYRWRELPDDPWLTLCAWRRVLPAKAVFAGSTAAWLFGLDLAPTDPVEVVVPPSSGIRTRAGLLVRHVEIPSPEVVTTRGLRTTALPLTLAGLCQRWPAVEALVALDMAVHRGLINPVALSQYAEAAKGRPGMPRLRQLALLAAPAESPMETRLRWLLIQARLPHPEVQASLRDSAARFVGRVDLYFPQARLAIEYDGGNHKERLVEDNRRQNALVNAGYRLLHFTAADIYGQADVVVAQVRAFCTKHTFRLNPKGASCA
jgi:very-short-patch-repair endonuclease